MDWEPAAIHIVGFFTQKVEKLGVAHGDQEVKAIVSITHDEEQGSFPVSQSVQLQLIIGCDLTQLCNVEYRKARTTGNQDRLGCFSGSQLVLLVLTDGEVVGLLGFQCIKHQVYGVFELLVILPDLHGVDELDEGREILLLYRGLIVDIANECAVQQGFCFYPKIVSGLAFAFGIGDQRRDQLQDVLFAMDVG